jgi:hypothetical protein
MAGTTTSARKSSSGATEASSKPVAINDLYFDARNPRLAEKGSPTTQEDILRVLWRDFAVDEIAYSIAANGYFEHEEIFATRERGRLVVIEGNRRVAAVKLLLDRDLREMVSATDLPRISSAEKRKLQTLPVVMCKRSELWNYVGFRHVNGPQAWQSYSKAKYIGWVHNDLRVPLDEIAERIGDRHSTVQRLYRALMALEQAEEAGVFLREDRWKKHFAFSHLYTGFDYAGIRSFVGLTEARSRSAQPIPKSKISNLGQLCEWLYGNKPDGVPPIVLSQNPDLRILDEVLQSKNGTAALIRGLPLRTSQDISKGDEQLFREALVQAKQSLLEARGRVLTGYEGESDMLATAEDIKEVADSLLAEMEEMRARRRTARKVTRKPNRKTPRKTARKRTGSR